MKIGFSRIVHALAAVSLCLLCVAGLSGCLESDVLVTRVLDPSSENVDYDNPQKNFVFKADAKQTIEDFEDQTDTPSEETQKVEEDAPIYDTDNTNSTQEAESGKSSEVSNSTTTAAKKTESAEEAPSSEGNKNNESKNDGKNNSGEGDEGGSSSGEGDESGGESDDKGDQDSKVTEPGKSYNANGKPENLPTTFSSVCATQDVAPIVLSIAGSDCLAGTSEDFIKDSSVKKVFGSQALSSVEACWKGDGSAAESADVDAIIKAKPDAVLTTAGGKSLSSADQKKLKNAGISVIAMPGMISDAYIRKAVKAVGQLFSDHTKGSSASKASSYDAMVSSVLDAAMATHGSTVSAYNKIDYNNVDNANPTNSAAGPASNWTVLLTEWDEGARATASFNGSKIFTEQGVALARVGWKTSPVSYYMGCGGVVNNAAAYASYSSESVRMFLTMNENQVDYSWSGLSDGVTVGKDGGSFKQGGTYLLSNACDARENESSHRLGSSDFNKVVVKTKTIARNLDTARKRALGLYTPGTYLSLAGTTGYGINIDGRLLRTYTTAADPSHGSDLYSILVNPSGLMGSWTEGSMESFLEAAWAAKEFCGYDEGALRSNVADFYQEFYGYSLTNAQIDEILSGSYAED